MEKKGLCTLKINKKDRDIPINKKNIDTGNKEEKVTQYYLAQINAPLKSNKQK